MFCFYSGKWSQKTKTTAKGIFLLCFSGAILDSSLILEYYVVLVLHSSLHQVFTNFHIMLQVLNLLMLCYSQHYFSFFFCYNYRSRGSICTHDTDVLSEPSTIEGAWCTGQYVRWRAFVNGMRCFGSGISLCYSTNIHLFFNLHGPDYSSSKKDLLNYQILVYYDYYLKICIFTLSNLAKAHSLTWLITLPNFEWRSDDSTVHKSTETLGT